MGIGVDSEVLHRCLRRFEDLGELLNAALVVNSVGLKRHRSFLIALCRRLAVLEVLRLGLQVFSKAQKR